jgi:hypothetical protein
LKHAAVHIDEINALMDAVDMNVICISETWYKGWHTNKRICIPAYRVVRADRKDGRRGGGVAMFFKSNLKFKVLARSPDKCLINYLFVEIKYYGHHALHAWFTIVLESMGFLYTQKFLKVRQFNQPRFNFPQKPTISKSPSKL